MSNYNDKFETLIKEKLSLYRSIAVKIVNVPADADDVVQLALLKAWQKRYSFKSDTAAMSAWVCRIVVTVSYDFLRKKMRNEKIINSYQSNIDNNENLQLDKLDRAIMQLPELYRETVHIAILSDLDGESAAKILGCSPNTLYQRIHKAKSLLKEILGGISDDE